MKLDMVGIIVEDTKQAITFYKTLGFEVNGDENGDYVELINDGVRISLNTKKMIEGVYGFVPIHAGDKIELAFSVEEASKVDEVCDKMKQAGYEIVKEPWDAFWGQRYCIIKDMDQNLLSIFATLG